MKVYPPAELLQRCPYTAFEGETYRDAIGYALDLQAVIELCNKDKDALMRLYPGRDNEF